MLLTIVILLTLLTQVGGLLWLLSLRLANLTRPPSRWRRRLSGLAVFLLLYAVSVAVVVPKLAAKGGRVPLPCFATEDTPLEPANLGYCLLMRNYVKPTIKTHLTDVARQFHQTYPDTTVRYLDAGFPFLDGFPLLPHLSHTDGGKVDLAYFYQRKATGEPVDFSPAWLGYWFYEQPSSPKEQACPGKPGWLRWDFDWLQSRYAAYALDVARTRLLLQLLAVDAQKILLEPHLQRKLGVQAANIRFQGCHASRHDDHIHAQW